MSWAVECGVKAKRGSTRMVWEHEYPIWEKHYPRGRHVLDVGAEEESIQFFKTHGAEKVYAIGDEVGSHVDAIKIDIDGAEWGMVVETHGYKPELELLYVHPRGRDVRIYRLRRGRRLQSDTAWKRFRLWLNLRGRIR